jgi:hypothetical protein
VGEAERRYSDEEVRRILADAARAEHVPGDPPGAVTPQGSSDGLTLGDIQQIAREALIDPAAVARAAGNLRDRESIRVPAGAAGPFTRVVRGELWFPRRLSDVEIQAMGLEVERVLGLRGHLRRSAEGTEWRDEEKRLSVLVVRGEAATRVLAAHDQSGQLAGGSALLAGAGTGGAVIALSAVAAPMLLAVLPLVVAGTTGLVWLNAVGRTATTRDRLRELLEHIEQFLLSGAARR